MTLANLALAGLLVVGPQGPQPQVWSARTALPVQGLVTFYAPGVMESVYRYRLEHGDVPSCLECVGHIAMPRAGDIGRKVWLIYQGRKTGPYLVIDCAQPAHFAYGQSVGHVAEVDWPTARAFQMFGPVTMTVVATGPPIP